MIRPLIAVLLLLAAGSAQAQAPACTYDTCALRLRNRFWTGISLVQGGDARRVARLGLFAPHIDLLASANDSAKTHYLAFRTRQNRGGALLLVSAVFAGAAGGLLREQATYDDHKTLFWSLLSVGFVFSVWGGADQVSARDQLQQAIWYYNRGLPR
jgi:hypothetical protein